MKHKLLIFIVGLGILSVIGSYYLLNPDKFPIKIDTVKGVDTQKCMASNLYDIEESQRSIELMRGYLAKNENTPLTTHFVAKAVEGTSCISMKIADFELYELTDESLVILKGEKKYKIISKEMWKIN